MHLVSMQNKPLLCYTCCYRAFIFIQMVQIFSKEYAYVELQPTKNAVAVFTIEEASLAFNYRMLDFVIVLNEKTGKFAYCKNLHECEEFLNAL